MCDALGTDDIRKKGGAGSTGTALALFYSGKRELDHIPALLCPFQQRIYPAAGLFMGLFQFGQVFFDTGQVFFDTGQVLFDTGQVLFDTGQVLFDAGQVLFDAGQVLFDTGQIFFDTGQVLFDTGQVLFDVGQVLFDTGQVLFDVGQVFFDAGQIFLHRRKQFQNLLFIAHRPHPLLLLYGPDIPLSRRAKGAHGSLT